MPLHRFLAALCGFALFGAAPLGAARAATPAPTAAPAPVLPTPTLDAVRHAGVLSCGAVAVPEDWTKTDGHGNISPFAIEICKAMSVAALGAKAKLAMHLYASAIEAGAGLRRGEVQVVAGITPNLTGLWRDGISFGAPIFYDGLTVLVRGDSTIHDVADLGGAKVCFILGGDTEATLTAHTIARGIRILPFPFQEEGEMEDGLSVRHCDAIAAQYSHLAIERAAYPKSLGHDRILPDWMTMQPLAVATRAGDAQWQALMSWTVWTLEEAEALGITQANVATVAKDPAMAEDPAVQRLLGTDWAAARALGLADRAWAAKVIAVSGNYAEIYDRTIGRALHLPRGRNALWSQGGLLVPMPVQ